MPHRRTRRPHPRTIRGRALLLAGALATLSAAHATSELPREDAMALARAATQPGSRVTIRAGTLLDGRGGAQRDVVVTVEGSRIVAVAPWRAGGPVTWDLSAMTLMPGLIDTHVHIDAHFGADGRASNRGETAAERMIAAAANAQRTLLAGFTTVQSLGSPQDVELRRHIAAGTYAGPRLITSAGQFSDTSRTPDEIRQWVRETRARGADVIKIFASRSIRDGGGQTLTDLQIAAACGEARAQGVRSWVHAHAASAIRAAAMAGCTGVTHGTRATSAELALMAERGTYFEPNIGLVIQNYLENKARFLGIGNYTEEGFRFMEEIVPVNRTLFREAIRTPGLKVVMGTDAVAGGHGQNAREIIFRVREAGQPAGDAIIAATSLAAEALGIGDSVGTIAVGHVADLVAVEGDPLADITALQRIGFVMARGEPVKAPPRERPSGAAPGAAAGAASLRNDWPTYGGDAGGLKYSSAADVDRTNVHRLEVAFSWEANERPIPAGPDQKPARPGLFQATPLAIGDTLFFPTPYNRVIALDAASGRELWTYDPQVWKTYGQPSNGTGFVHRGVATWTDGTSRRIFLNSRWRLIALDASTGRPIAGFGSGGEIDLTTGLSRPVRREHYTNTSPPVIWGDLVIVGNGVGDRLMYRGDPPGDVQAFDVRTGRRVWRFKTVPEPGEFGNETWGDSSWAFKGHTNVWAPFTVDSARGLVYLPVGTPSDDWYGGERPGANLFAESLVCLDARTGRRVWHFQVAHHGLWDYDLPAPPNLLTVQHEGRATDIVVAPTKQGFLFAFERATGRPLWPIEERAVPASDVPGERAWPTQPFPTRPAPFSAQGFTRDDVTSFTPALRQAALDEIATYRTGPLYTPPSLEGTVTMPGVIGGAGWGGAAVDPATGWLFVKASNSPALFTLRRHEQKSDTIDTPYLVDLPRSTLGVSQRDNAEGAVRASARLPINKPPYGTLTAVDMNTGETRWTVPLGDTPEVRDHPALRGAVLPERLGVAGSPGALVTGGGLVFVSGGGRVLHAIDTRSGVTLWEHDVGQVIYANPMTYRTRDGRQFVAVATGGGATSRLVVFSLPRR
ncbi:MAG: PQQ-binding-like beta-propeller repeat protein [Gemmatimonadetes bacterium]|nr:PQQ-binding-like beta-propeller repeat protein [Gemmatimonadota bacterium]